ncbi:hypothetical protein TREMEDRAFT_60771 [Tremella mesenterica DSM 1558]|uniref:uncharacterized protein n=1 Tax=Tremella mesenterica (strain ATCC 24925 / CBS 8224 / DSM 1558 / NBRC 9311 / NRRL Y-6157 / RJB 2259-6 / UBC 559-6) TaxID=578456 RepID=UPI0003F49248|nr:uncharacterized protein TREMEDRAFT_60771 [Tremella mesenterica DSM 1558]EIW71851.1 hypothetical protein TREMEDRAFT_60771 [Tremella mesenterica DSM 1558]
MPSTDVARMAMERLSSFKGRVEHEQTRDLEATFGDSHGSCENVKEDPRTTGHSKSSQKATITSGTNEPSQNHSLELPAELSDLERSLLTACRKGYTVLPARSFFADIKGPKEVAWVHFRKHSQRQISGTNMTCEQPKEETSLCETEMKVEGSM